MALTTGLTDEFKAIADKAAKLMAFQENLVAAGLKSDSVAGVIDNSATASKEAQNSIHDKARQQAKNRFEDALYTAMLNNINDGIQQLRDQSRNYQNMIDTEWERLTEFYGDEADQTFYEQIFGEDGSHLTVEERLEAIQGEMLDDDGQIKLEYSDHPLAKLMELRGSQDQIDATLTDVERRYSEGDYEGAEKVLRESPYVTLIEATSSPEVSAGVNEMAIEIDAANDAEITETLDSREEVSALFTSFTAAVNPEDIVATDTENELIVEGEVSVPVMGISNGLG